MRARFRQGGLAVGMVAALTTMTVTAAGAQSVGGGGGWSGPPLGSVRSVGSVQIVADHLNQPRQIVRRLGAVYVAEAGTGGTNCVPHEPCLSFTGSVTRVWLGVARRIQTGLLSLNDHHGSVIGLDALAFRGSELLGIVSSECFHEPPPAEVAAQAGKVLRLTGGTSFTEVGEVSSIECGTNPDGQEAETDPYGIAVRGSDVYVADAAGNTILRVRRGQTTLTSVLSHDAQPVPTALAFGPDGALYIGTLDFVGGPGGAKVLRLDPGTGQVTTFATGLTAITAMAFTADGRLVVCQYTAGYAGPHQPRGDGSVVIVPRDGAVVGRVSLGVGALHYPTGVALSDRGVYVSNWGIAPAEDSTFGPGNRGQLVHIAYPGL
jgi:hypothetical protein